MVLIGIDPYPYLIGGLEDVFHSVGTFMIPTGPKSIIFQRGRAQPPTNQIILWYVWWIIDGKLWLITINQ